MNFVLVALMVGSVVAALFGGQIDALPGAMVEAARSAVELALRLIGGLALWLGLMAVAEASGLMRSLARLLEPLILRLFPSIPARHPAIGAMIMNFSANILGMDNAATAFGVKAMHALNRLNGAPGVATNAMVLFLAINTAGIQAIPINVIGARGAVNPATAGATVFPTLLVSLFGLLVGVALAKLFGLLPAVRASEPPAKPDDAVDAAVVDAPDTQAPLWQRVLSAGAGVALVAGIAYRLWLNAQANGAGVALRGASSWTFALIAAAILAYGWYKGVKLYEAAVSGAREGFDIAVRIMPYLVIILVGVGMFRASGLLDALVTLLTPATSLVGMPPEVLPQALVRPLSGSAAMGLLVDTLKTYGPDSPAGFISSLIYGSSETTFYVLSVYFGAIGVKNMRHALAACLCADIAGVFIAVWVGRWFL